MSFSITAFASIVEPKVSSCKFAIIFFVTALIFLRWSFLSSSSLIQVNKPGSEFDAVREGFCDWKVVDVNNDCDSDEVGETSRE